MGILVRLPVLHGVTRVHDNVWAGLQSVDIRHTAFEMAGG